MLDDMEAVELALLAYVLVGCAFREDVYILVSVGRIIFFYYFHVVDWWWLHSILCRFQSGVGLEKPTST